MSSTWRESESAMVSRLRAGDETAFGELVTELSPVLLRLARNYTATASAAQEAVQDAWLVFVEKIVEFEGQSSLKPWVCGIVVNKARRAGTSERRSLPLSSVWRDEHEPAVAAERFHSRFGSGATGTWISGPARWDLLPERVLESAEVRRVIGETITALPVRQREVMTARDVVGMNPEETCELLGLTAGNQRVLLHRARSKVRDVLEHYGRADGRGAPAPGSVSIVRPVKPAAGHIERRWSAQSRGIVPEGPTLRTCLGELVAAASRGLFMVPPHMRRLDTSGPA